MSTHAPVRRPTSPPVPPPVHTVGPETDPTGNIGMDLSVDPRRVTVKRESGTVLPLAKAKKAAEGPPTPDALRTPPGLPTQEARTASDPDDRRNHPVPELRSVSARASAVLVQGFARATASSTAPSAPMVFERPAPVTEGNTREYNSRARAQSAGEPVRADPRPVPKTSPRNLGPTAPNSQPALRTFGPANVHGFGATPVPSDPLGHGSGTSSRTLTVPNVMRGEAPHVSWAESGIRYSKGPNGRWDFSPLTPEPSRSPLPANSRQGIRPIDDSDASAPRAQFRGADPKRRADRRRHILEGIRPTGDGDDGFDPDDDGRGVGRMPSPPPVRNRKPRPPPPPPPAPDPSDSDSDVPPPPVPPQRRKPRPPAGPPPTTPPESGPGTPRLPRSSRRARSDDSRYSPRGRCQRVLPR